MVNGYVTLDLASNKIYNESLNAIKSGKPVMVVDTPNVYFADTIKVATIDDDKVVVITKGGKTITIANDNIITNVGDINIKTYVYNFEIYQYDGENIQYEFSGIAISHQPLETISDLISKSVCTALYEANDSKCWVVKSIENIGWNAYAYDSSNDTVIVKTDTLHSLNLVTTL